MMHFMPGTRLGQKNTESTQPSFNNWNQHKHFFPPHNPNSFNGDYSLPPHSYGHYGFDQYYGLAHDHNEQQHHHHHYGYGHRFLYHHGYSFR